MSSETKSRNALIVNADDWGRSRLATDRTLECVLRGSVSSVSAMVFMEDSARAAQLAIENGVDVGLHLNLTTAFTAKECTERLRAEQLRLGRFLRRHRMAPALYHPMLASTFRDVIAAQICEFTRLYGYAPLRIDSHHHMHLCANIIAADLLPRGGIVRRNFSFFPGEKGWINRNYRSWQDKKIARRHACTDFFFDLQPLEHSRLTSMHVLAQSATVEVECHPERDDEYRFLMSDGLESLFGWGAVTKGYDLYASLRKKSEETGKVMPHICICICTYKRPGPLLRLLKSLAVLKTEGRFTLSLAIADNDVEGSARSVVEAFRRDHALQVKYGIELRHGIAYCRNAVVAMADGDYLAFVDDDEYVVSNWLLHLFTACRSFAVDGVLGPVKNTFDHSPPRWLQRCDLLERSIQPTGASVVWTEARTGNVLLRAVVAKSESEPFRVVFSRGEDQDFFRRKIDAGFQFCWSAEALAWEVVPSERWTRRYYLRRAVENGRISKLLSPCSAGSIAKSILALLVYAGMLPLRVVQGEHRVMDLLIRACFHLGRLQWSAHER